MTFRVCCALFVLVFLDCIIGCTQLKQITTEEAIRDREKISQLVLKNGLTADFDQEGARHVTMGEGIREITRRGEIVFIPLDSIVEFRTDSPPSLKRGQFQGAVIAEIVLTDQMLVSFDKDGATYEEKLGVFKGMTVDGEMISYSIKRIASVRTAKPETLTKAEFLLNPDRIVREAVVHGGTLVMFGSNGGNYTKGTNSFVGKSVHGEFMEVPMNEVLYPSVTKDDIPLTILATASAIAVLGGVLFAIALAY